LNFRRAEVKTFLGATFAVLFLQGCQIAPFRSGLSGGITTPSTPARESALTTTSEFPKNLRWPLRIGKLTQYFGSDGHWGIDIAAPKGTKIFAAHAGQVLYSGKGFRGYGKFLIVEAGQIATFYSHCNSLLVKQGQWVEQGQQIATVGRTGNATGPHLHFEVRKNRTPVDPLVYLPLE
jgi:murein DD-endopeptidase MepM/ murein hydrolase activator NlpD